ncbi:MAG: inorganic diphosphatase [Bernardetiaceae bacterium]
MNPWHRIPVGKKAPEIVQSVIEIPKGSRAKYELDKDTGLLRLDRVLYSAMYYPANYGFIPRTFCDDGDPLDILVISMIDVVPLCILNAKVVGVMRMLDGGEADDKIIAVAQDDISINHIERIEDFPEHLLKETLNFFEDYKKLENKTVKVEEFESREVALEIVKKALEDYNSKILPTLTYF